MPRTPGPWEVVDAPEPKTRSCAVVQRLHDHSDITRLNIEIEVNSPFTHEAAENALLIAAALPIEAALIACIQTLKHLLADDQQAHRSSIETAVELGEQAIRLAKDGAK